MSDNSHFPLCSDEEDDDEDDEQELMRELEKIKAERAAAKARQEAEAQRAAQEGDQEAALKGNPLLNLSGAGAGAGGSEKVCSSLWQFIMTLFCISIMFVYIIGTDYYEST